MTGSKQVGLAGLVAFQRSGKDVVFEDTEACLHLLGETDRHLLEHCMPQSLSFTRGSVCEKRVNHIGAVLAHGFKSKDEAASLRETLRTVLK